MGRRHGWVRAVSAAIVLAVALAGCSAPPAVGDGSLGVDWAVLPTPSVPTPEVGTCTGRDGTRATPKVGWDMSYLLRVTAAHCGVQRRTPG